MGETVYKWKTGYTNKVTAQAAGQELNRIRNDGKQLTPKTVVDESRTESAVLHDCFDWNDETAAESYREVQAGMIMRNIAVTVVCGKEVPEPVRAYVHIGSEYKHIDEAVSVVVYKNDMLEQAHREFICFRRKYQILSELAALFESADKVFEMLTKNMKIDTSGKKSSGIIGTMDV